MASGFTLVTASNFKDSRNTPIPKANVTFQPVAQNGTPLSVKSGDSAPGQVSSEPISAFIVNGVLQVPVQVQATYGTGSPNITLTNAASLVIGAAISGIGIPSNTVILSGSGQSYVLSQTPTVNGVNNEYVSTVQVGIALADMNMSNPSLFGYAMSVTDPNSGRSLIGPGYSYVQWPEGDTFDLDTYVPVITAPLAAVVAGAPGTPGAAGQNGAPGDNASVTLQKTVTDGQTVTWTHNLSTNTPQSTFFSDATGTIDAPIIVDNNNVSTVCRFAGTVLGVFRYAPAGQAPPRVQAIHHWAFNEGTGTTIADTGTTGGWLLTGTPGWQTGVSGVPGGITAELAGDSNGLNTGHPLAGFDGNTPMSFSAFLQQIDLNWIHDLFSTAAPGDTTYKGISLSANNGNVQFAILNAYNAAEFIVSASSVIQAGVLHHVALSYDGSATLAGCTLYIDGNPVTLTTVANNLGGASASSGSNLIVASTRGVVMNSQYAGLRVYDYAITQAQVQQDMQSV
jgi:hypothetical protein